VTWIVCSRTSVKANTTESVLDADLSPLNGEKSIHWLEFYPEYCLRFWSPKIWAGDVKEIKRRKLILQCSLNSILYFKLSSHNYFRFI